MADKTTTLKTTTGDNVYPNVIGDNRKNAFVDSSTITHHFYDKTHKVGFQINNETNIKIQNSLQKPAGLTKTKLVGVGTNGQENIEIGDNLTLANGKLSATGGGGGGGGAGKTYLHSITIVANAFFIGINIYSNSNTKLTLSNLENLMSNYGYIICTGYYKTSTTYGMPRFIGYNKSYHGIALYYFDTQDKNQKDIRIRSNSALNDTVSEII